MSRTLLVTIAVVALASLGVAGAGLSGASFHSAAVKRGETVAEGRWTGLSATNLKPGESRSHEVSIANPGSREAAFTLSEREAVNPFGAHLQLAIAEAASGRPVYSGELGRAGSLELGTLAAGAQRTYRFTVSLAATAPNGAQGRTATAEYRWEGARR